MRTDIKKLPEELRMLARRIVQCCGREPDGGIALADITQAADHPGLLPDERELLVDIRVALLPFAKKQATVMRPILEVPEPRRYVEKLEYAGSTPISVVSTIKYEETASTTSDRSYVDRRISMNQARPALC